MPRKDKIHDKIVSILLEVVKNDTNTYFNVKGKLPEFEVSREFPKYTPDVHAFVKRSKDQVDVFQVWRGESTEVAVFDLLRCSMIPRVRRLHVVTAPQEKPGYSWTRKDVFNLKNTLLKLLLTPYSKNLRRMLVRNCVIELTKEDLESYESIKKRITRWYEKGLVLK